MALLGRSLAKLTLTAYRDKDGNHRLGTFVAMFNPESIRFEYEASYRVDAPLNRSEEYKFEKMPPPGLDLELVLDSRVPGERRTIEQQLGELREVCFSVREANAPSRSEASLVGKALSAKKEGPGKKAERRTEPAFLRISWGNMAWHGQGYFSGLCQRLGVSYTLFDRNAQPLRAIARLSLVGVDTGDLMATKPGSGGLRQMLKGISAHDSLPLIASMMGTAATASDYLKLGHVNGLDNLRDLIPGKSLITG